MRPSITKSLDEATHCLQQFRDNPSTVEAMNSIATVISEAFRTGQKVMVCGNGGSMADAMHVAEEFSGRFYRDRKPYPAMAFSDPAHLSCVANDYGYDQVFVRMVAAFGKPGDVLIVMSTSGNSDNVVLAAEKARELGITVVGALGKGGGKLSQLCDIQLHAPGSRSDRIQELHMLAFHMIIEAVEGDLGH
jgi:D-sedoheptulose 7-phosphate isomerase